MCATCRRSCCRERVERQDADWTVGTDEYVDLSYPGAGFGPTSKDDCKNGGWLNLTDAL
jgi:hypothetical protein